MATTEQDRAVGPTTGVVRIDHWIGGRRIATKSGRSGPVYNPASGRKVAEVGFADPAEVDLAVRTARAAFPKWREASLSRRTEIFFAIRHLVASRRDEIARIVTSEHGKVLSDATAEVQVGIEMVEYACGLAELLKGSFSEQASAGYDVRSVRQPLGVVAGVTPFNFPAMVPMWMWPLAIACGNTFVLKVSERLSRLFPQRVHEVSVSVRRRSRSRECAAHTNPSVTAGDLS